MTVVFSRPYQFVPPHEGNVWPTLIQRLRLVDRYLRNKEGIVDHDCRGLQHIRQSLDSGDGILWAPNHCRYADPLVMCWPARRLNTQVFAMASWHLFNNNRFDSFAIPKMGAFSIFREGTDRQSIETAIDILANAKRPLILFPEGTTNRINDVLLPLLEGVTFIARSAARRAAKKSGRRVVIHPIAIKYLCQTDIRSWAQQQLDELESRVGWRPCRTLGIRQRTVRMLETYLSLKEIEYIGHPQSGSLGQRRDQLIEFLLRSAEQRLELETTEPATPRDRIRAIRSHAAANYFQPSVTTEQQERLRREVAATDLAQELLTFHEDYLSPENATDSRIVETIQRMQGSFGKKPDLSIPLKVIIQFDRAIEVPPRKAPRHQEDPLLTSLRERLTDMVQQLSREARPLRD